MIRQSQLRIPTAPASPSQEDERLASLGLCRLPSSSHLHFIHQVTAFGAKPLQQGCQAGLEEMPKRLKRINRNARYRYSTSGDQVTLQKAVDGTITSVTITPQQLTKSSELLLAVLLDTAAFAIPRSKEGRLQGNELSIPLQRLLAKGMYADAKSLRDAIDRGRTGVLSTGLSISTEQNAPDSCSPLFAKMYCANGCLNATLNATADWGQIYRYQTYAPSYIYSLSTRARRMLLSICYHARQRHAAPFGMRLETLALDAGLPSVEQASSLENQIRKPLLSALREISETESKLLGAGILPEPLISLELHDARDEYRIRGGREWAMHSYLSIVPQGGLSAELLATLERNEAARQKAIERWIVKKKQPPHLKAVSGGSPCR